tara:strand:+ start:1329 stop:2078 length:750 start_codon:yes stop_codon:yes gene_type:complete
VYEKNNKKRVSMKKQLLFAFTIISTSAGAVDNLRTAVSTNNNLMIHQQNLENIQKMEETKTLVEEGILKYQTCIDKGLLYLGDGASNVDADKCYDLTNTLNPDSTFRPTFAGHTSAQFSFRSGQPNYSSSVNSRFELDKRCHSQYSGSRAMTYDDIKYIWQDLIAPANIDKKTWVVDSAFAMHNSTGNRYIPKYLHATADHIRDCNGWNATSANDRGSVFIKRTYNSSDYMDFTNQTCDSSAYLACVYN